MILAMGIHDHIASDRALVQPSEMPAAVGVIDEPDTWSRGRSLQDHDVMSPYRSHARRRQCARKAQPVAGSIERRDDLAEHTQAGAAAAELVGTASGPAADHFGFSARYDTGKRQRRHDKTEHDVMLSIGALHALPELFQFFLDAIAELFHGLFNPVNHQFKAFLAHELVAGEDFKLVYLGANGCAHLA